MNAPQLIVGNGFEWDDRKSEKKALVREAVQRVREGATTIDAARAVYDRYHRTVGKHDDADTLERNEGAIARAIRLYIATHVE